MAVKLLVEEAVTLLIKLQADLIDMVSCVHSKCQTRTGVSGDVNKTLECVTITDSKFSNRVLVRMTPKNTSVNWVTIRLELLDFCPRKYK